LAKVLTDKYSDLLETGRHVTTEDIQRDVRLMLKENFLSFLAR
jgi:hypothetical protein